MEQINRNCIHLQMKPTHEMIELIRHNVYSERMLQINFEGSVPKFIDEVFDSKINESIEPKRKEYSYKFTESQYLPEGVYDYQDPTTEGNDSDFSVCYSETDSSPSVQSEEEENEDNYSYDYESDFSS